MGIHFFSKTKKNSKTFKYRGKYETGYKITHRIPSKDWSGGQKTTYSSPGSPAESPVLLYRITHLITIGRGLPTYSINLQTVDF